MDMECKHCNGVGMWYIDAEYGIVDGCKHCRGTGSKLWRLLNFWWKAKGRILAWRLRRYTNDTATF